MKVKAWKKYGFEFLSIFVAVVAAFALNNWNDNRKSGEAERKILEEIEHGLKKDLEDIYINIEGHKVGIKACDFWRTALLQDSCDQDSVVKFYFHLTRDFISIQNISGYETLKSNGLELVRNDSLRSAIISLYEYDFNTLKILEEEYSENQFHESYFSSINELLTPQLKFNALGGLAGVNLPLQLTDDQEKQLLVCLWRMQINRMLQIQLYQKTQTQVDQVRKLIAIELGNQVKA